MQINEQIGLFCFNCVIKTDGKGLVDGFVTGVDFRFGSYIVWVKLSGKVSIQVNFVLIGSFALTLNSPGLIPHSVGPVKHFKAHFIGDFGVKIKWIHPVETNLTYDEFSCMNVANDDCWVLGLSWVDGHVRISGFVLALTLNKCNCTLVNNWEWVNVLVRYSIEWSLEYNSAGLADWLLLE